MKLAMTLLLTQTSAPVAPIWKGRRQWND